MAETSDIAPDTPSAPKESLKRKIATSRSSSAYPRKRAVAACQVCRVRRTKCDNNRPTCSFCASSGANCVYDQNDQSSFDPASLAILERLKVLESSVSNLTSVVDNVPIGNVVQGAASGTSTMYDDMAKQHDIERLLPQNVDRVWTWQAFRGMCSPSPDVLTYQSPRGTTSRAPPGELDLLHLQQYVDRYFRYVNAKNPILDESETQLMVDVVFDRGADETAETVLVLLVCALGAVAQNYPDTSPSSNEVDQSAAMIFFKEAQRGLGSVLSETGLMPGRCCFLAGTLLMAILRPFDAWRMFMQALTMCQASTERETDPDYAQSPAATTAMESLYWSAWKSEREVRAELNPPDFQKACLRFPPAFKCLTVDPGKKHMEDWYFYLSEISIWRIETVARSKMESIVASKHQDVLNTLADLADDVLSQVSAWRDSLSPSVSVAPEDAIQLSKGLSVYKFVLRGRTTYIHELITWPFVYSCLHSLTSQLRHWKWFERGLAFHLERLSINRPGFYFRHHGTWLMMRSSARSASILLAAAQTASTRTALPKGWEDLVRATIDMLHFWAEGMLSMRGIAEQLQSLYVSIISRAETT